MRSRTAMVLASVCLSQLLIVFIPSVQAICSQAGSPASAQGNNRSIAESQHEIVMILMKKKEYAQALEEAKKIFSMKWPPEQESTLLRELLYFSDQFLHANQPAMGIQLLEGSKGAFKTNKGRAAICKAEGYLYKRLNEDDRALECFREAQRLER